MTLALPSLLSPSEETIREMARTARCPTSRIRRWLRDTRKRSLPIQGRANVAMGRKRTRDTKTGRFVVGSTIYEPMRLLSQRAVDVLNEQICHVQEKGLFREDSKDGKTYLSVPTHTFQSDAYAVQGLNNILSRHVYPFLPRFFRLHNRDARPSVVYVYVFSEEEVIGLPYHLLQAGCMYGVVVKNLNDEDIFVNGYTLEKGCAILIKGDYVRTARIKCAFTKQHVLFMVM